MEGDAYDDGVNELGGAAPSLRGLVVDWGGVLTAALDGAMASWVEHDGIDHDHFRDVMRSWVERLPAGADHGSASATPVADLEQADDEVPARTSPVHLLERGELGVPEFERELAAELGRRGSPVVAEGLLDRMLSGLRSLDPRMVAMLRRARSLGVRTALLSNSWGDHYPEQLWDGLFDAIVISGRVGMRKPEPEIFRHACAQLGLTPPECVMVDDLPHNVHAAVAVGMVAVHHRSYAETLAELEVLFDLPLAP